MNKIITVGRQFGSGGREFGKRLAEELGYAYYDREIMQEIAKRTQLAEEYIRQIVEQRPSYHFPITVGRTLHGGTSDFLMHQQTSVYAEQVNTLREMAKTSDCVIVGCCADYILRDLKPTRIFIYADMEARTERCRNRGGEEASLSDKQLKRKILSVDRNRGKYYRYYTGQVWGNRNNYDFCINTSHTVIKSAAHALAVMMQSDQ